MFTGSKISKVLLFLLSIFSIVLYLFSQFKANYSSRPRIVVTNYFAASLCNDLCRGSASISVIASNSFCCGDFEPTLKDLVSIIKSDAFIYYENDIISLGQLFGSFLKAHIHNTKLFNLTQLSINSDTSNFLLSCREHDMNMYKCNCETTNSDSKGKLLFQNILALEGIIDVLYSFLRQLLFKNSRSIDEHFIKIKKKVNNIKEKSGLLKSKNYKIVCWGHSTFYIFLKNLGIDVTNIDLHDSHNSGMKFKDVKRAYIELELHENSDCDNANMPKKRTIFVVESLKDHNDLKVFLQRNIGVLVLDAIDRIYLEDNSVLDIMNDNLSKLLDFINNSNGKCIRS